MTVATQISDIQDAEATSYNEHPEPFDTVTLCSSGNSRVSLFLPHGTGQAVADAINAAVKPADEVSA